LLRAFRIDAGLSQEALAERARVSVNGISALERGIRRVPQAETLALLVSALALTGDVRRSFEDAARGRASVTSPEAVAPACEQMTSLPLPPTTFLGREREVAEIGALLADHRLVTLVGSGGIGKTRTSLEVARTLRDVPRDGVWFVELAPVTSDEYVASTIGMVLGFDVASDGDAEGKLVRLLADKHALIVLDNCEHVIDASARIAASIVRECRGVSIFASSRQVLGVSGERTYRLPSLDVPAPEGGRPLTRADAMEYAAIALFVDRAQAADQQFLLTDENAGIIAEICRRLDGIALAIELAAPRVKILNPRQLRDRLDERFRVLTGGSRDAMPRQRTLRATIDWSYELLDDRERMLLRRLSIFAGGFSIEGAIAVACGDGLDEFAAFDRVASLVDKSLLLAEHGGDEIRYRMLESTRAYGREMLDASGERESRAHLHLRHFTEMFVALDEQSEVTGRYAELEAAFSRDLEDLRIALDHAERTSVELGAHLLTAITEVPWQTFGLVYEMFARGDAHLEILPNGAHRSRARILASQVRPYITVGHVARAVEIGARSVAEARCSDTPTRVYALCRYAFALTNARRFDEAAAAIAEAEAYAAETARTQDYLLYLRASLCAFSDDHERAVELWRRRIANLGSSNDMPFFVSMNNLAESTHALGDSRLAIELMASMLPAVRFANERAVLGSILTNFAAYLAAVDSYEASLTAAREVIAFSAEMASTLPRIGQAMEVVALVLALQDDVIVSALLEGFADAVLGRAGFARAFTERKTHARLFEILERSLPADELAVLLSQGADLTPEAAIRLGLGGGV
jgi:predicted ATPase/DNA-binding XRE family transcriptional regulator